MTSDEALIEKMAEAMWNAHGNLQKIRPWDTAGDETREDYRLEARAALSVVRDHDKQGLVHAQSTGAERSSIPTCVVTGVVVGLGAACGDCDPCIFGRVPAPVQRLIDERNRLEELYCDALAMLDDRSVPAAPREPNLPSSLLTRLDVPGGLTKG